MTIYCATTNAGKVREFRQAGERAGVRIEPLPGIGTIPPVPETGTTFEANAVEKALHYSRLEDGAVFADDSGLEVDALGGEPGVLSARYAGQGATDAANNTLLLERMAGVAQRSARFVCVIALAAGGRLAGTFRGAVEGVILAEPRGSGGFGYDPLFFHPPSGCTFGEIDPRRKQEVSHRGRALAAMFEHLGLRGPVRLNGLQ